MVRFTDEKIIDSQERSPTGESSLYANNKKLQTEKTNNPLCAQSLELVAQFLDHFDCRNTLQIFSSEANYQVENPREQSKVAEVLEFIQKEKERVRKEEICTNRKPNRALGESRHQQANPELSKMSESEKKGKLLKISLQGGVNSEMIIKTESTPANNDREGISLNAMQRSLDSKKNEMLENPLGPAVFSNKASEKQSIDFQMQKAQNHISKSNEWSSKNQEKPKPEHLDPDVKVNNFLNSEQSEKKQHDPFSKSSGMRLSHNENEEDFLKASSSRLNTDKESLVEENKQTQVKSKNEFQTNTLPNSESKQIYELPLESETKYDQPHSTSSKKKNLIFQEDPEEDIPESKEEKEAGKPSPSKNRYFKEDEVHVESKSESGRHAIYGEELEGHGQDSGEDEEDLGLIAEPEAVDVSVLTENLEEFDHDESPHEVLDSDEDLPEDDENELY